MSGPSTLGRLIRALPATAAAVLVALVLFALTLYQNVPGVADVDVPLELLPVVVIGLVLVALGLAADGGVKNRARTTWDSTVAMSATDLDRMASQYFADKGWTAQRDDEDFKVFVRRPRLNIGLLVILMILGVFPALIYLGVYALERPQSVSIAIAPVSAGAHVEIQGPWSAVDPFHRTLAWSLNSVGAGYPELKAPGLRR